MTTTTTTPILSLEDVLKGLTIAAAKGSNFASSLLGKRMKYGGWTPKQAHWAAIIADEKLNPKPRVGDALGGDMTEIIDKFKVARTKLKHPALLFFNVGGKAKVRVSLAPDKGKNPGCLYVKADGEYAGKITPSGEFFGARAATAGVKTFLSEFAKDPVGVGAANGKAAGACCYCSLTLTDPRSLEAGYGKVCAGHWALPWGKKAATPVAAETEMKIAA